MYAFVITNILLQNLKGFKQQWPHLAHVQEEKGVMVFHFIFFFILHCKINIHLKSDITQ